MCCGFSRGGELAPRLTQCGLGRGLLSYQVASSSIHPFGHNRHGPKTAGCAPFRRGAATYPSNTTSPGPRFLRNTRHLDPSCRLATIDMDKKLDGGCAVFFWGAGSPSNTKSPGPRPESKNQHKLLYVNVKVVQRHTKRTTTEAVDGLTNKQFNDSHVI